MTLIELFIEVCTEHPELVQNAKKNMKGQLYAYWWDYALCDDGTYQRIPLLCPWIGFEITKITALTRLEPQDVLRINTDARRIIAKGGGLTSKERGLN